MPIGDSDLGETAESVGIHRTKPGRQTAPYVGGADAWKK